MVWPSGFKRAAQAGAALVLFLACFHLGFAASGDTIADAVLGQPDFSSNTCINGQLTPGSLCDPIDAAVDPISGRLYVATDIDNRVLSWPSAAGFANGAPADLVIGQPDFVQKKCNQGSHIPTASGLCNPAGVAVDQAGNLYVADRKNSRVLEYDSPATTDTVADRVFGQPDFSSNRCNNGGISASSLCAPRGVVVDSNGNLYVSDEVVARVVEYDSALSTDAVADHVFGQPNFQQQGCASGPTGLCEPRNLAVDSAGNLYVADLGNQRVLEYLSPLTTDAVADRVFGQPNFTSNQCNSGGISARSLCGPRDVAVDNAGNVYIADSVNNRVLIYATPATSDTVADVVIGQPSFTTAACNFGGSVSARGLCRARGLGVDSAGNVYVADAFNNRVLRFDGPLVLRASRHS